uniref:Uncharacterized protein n=1 Tax=Tricholoma saponaceum TaxID=113602 RepID=A0A6C0W3S0_9AGAR|nr:hypothetical protein [Tricholoma saponaceum]QIC20278.1 hypothetical protein [Tricholoma saponaceum]
MLLKCYQFNLKQLIYRDIYVIFRYLYIPKLEPLFHSHESSNWEGIIRNNTLQLSQISKIPVYISLIQFCQRDINIIFPKGKLIKDLIFSKLNSIKTKLIIVLCIFKLIHLFNIRGVSNYLNPYSFLSSLVAEISFDDIFDLESLNSLLEIDLDIMFIILFVLITLITLIIINFIIIFFIMIFLYNYKLYTFFLVISLILPVYNINIKQLIKSCKLFGFFSINLLKILNCGLSPENILLLFNDHFNTIVISKISTHSFMGNETQTIITTNNEPSQPSQPSSSHQSLIYSNSDKDIAIDNNLDISENDNSDKDRSNNQIANIKFTDFNKELNLEEKYDYLKEKFDRKGIDHNIPYLDWFINLLNQTDGHKTNIDQKIEFNLNHILKMERESQLNNLAFFRNKPFLMNKFDHSPIALPKIIPVFKGLSIYGEEDIIEEKK